MTETNESRGRERPELVTPELIGRLAMDAYGEGNSAEILDRANYYRFATKPMDYYLEAYQAMGINPGDSVLDVGSSSGYGLVRFRMFHKHTGPLVGVDMAKKTFHNDIAKNIGNYLQISQQEPLHFVAAKGERLSFRKKSFRHGLCMFMIYHAEDAELVLNELDRVTEEGGGIGLATSGVDNKLYHRGFERLIGRALDLQPPPYFTEPFPSEGAEKVIRKVFPRARIRVIPHRDIAQFHEVTKYGTDGFDEYKKSLDTMRPYYKPEPPSVAVWDAAVHALVEPIVRKFMRRSGFFGDYIDRTIYIIMKDAA